MNKIEAAIEYCQKIKKKEKEETMLVSKLNGTMRM